MQIDEGIVKCVGFIGAESQTGFVADGTCFFVNYVEENESFLYVVTARHLVRPIKFGKETLPGDGLVRIRMSARIGAPRILDTVRKTWLPHSNRHIDACVRSFDLREFDPNDELDFNFLRINPEETSETGSILMTPEREKIFGPISMGDDVFIASLFPGHVGEKRNIPVVRVGNIAAPPLEVVRVGSPTVPAYLIETKSLGGTSGAPVFLHLQPQHTIRNVPRYWETSDGGRVVPYALIGIVLGLHSGMYASDFIQTDADEAIIGKDADFNAGISVVLPIQHVVDIIEGDELKSARKASLAAIQKQSGYRPASARSYPPTIGTAVSETKSDENRAHREDFNRLVSAASKPKPKDDRT